MNSCFLSVWFKYFVLLFTQRHFDLIFIQRTLYRANYYSNIQNELNIIIATVKMWPGVGGALFCKFERGKKLRVKLLNGKRKKEKKIHSYILEHTFYFAFFRESAFASWKWCKVLLNEEGPLPPSLPWVE